MAGIGFRLRELTKADTWSGLLLAYGFAGVIGSGPWVLSIVGILLIGILNTREFRDTILCRAVSDIGNLPDGGFVNPDESFAADTSCFIADRLYEKQDKQVLPN